jgi:AraC-like DNA-binding protein
MTAGANSLIDRVTAPPFGPSPTAPAHDLQVFFSAFETIGYDARALMAAVGVRDVDFLNPDGRIACSVFGALISCAQQQRRTANLALELARATPLGSWPLLDYLVLTSDTVSAGVQQLARYFRLTTSPVALTVHDEAAVRIELIGVAPFAIEYDAALMVLQFRLETGGRFAASSIRFRHRPDDPGGFERALGCPVVANAPFNEVVLSPAMWQLPLRRRDPVLRQMLEKHADAILEQLPAQTGIASAVQRSLVARVAGGDVRMNSVARELGTSARTLQRRLAEEGVTYQALVDDARKKAASRYLYNSTLAIGEVAYLVGFSEPAPFYRAFRRWFGVTPEQFRSRSVRTLDHRSLGEGG